MVRWSRARAMFRERMAPALRGRLDVHCTAYGVPRFGWYRTGRAWLSLDGVEFATVDSTLAGLSWVQFRCCSHRLEGDGLTAAVRSLLDLPAHEGLNASDPAIRALALCDARVGRRTLEALRSSPRHPLERSLLEVRDHCADGVDLPPSCHSCDLPRRTTGPWAPIGGERS